MSDERNRVAILGGGPVGLEAALAMAETGRPFRLYEVGESVGENVRAWGHVRLFSPWKMNVSPRAARHLPESTLPGEEELDRCPTGAELVERVLEPLAAHPKVSAGIRTGVRVEAVGRDVLLKHEEIGTGARSGSPFRLLLSDGEGREWVERAGVVLDCSGTYHNPNFTGDGGIPAPGEDRWKQRIHRRIPDPVRDAEEWEGRTVLLVGGGHSAQTAARDLAASARNGADVQVIWALRRADASWRPDPYDPLTLRSTLLREAREIVQGGAPGVEVRKGVVVERIRGGGRPGPDGPGLKVELRTRAGSTSEVEVDRILSLTGSVGDHHLYRQLQVHECYATQGPMKLAAALLGSSSEDCLDETGHGPETLANPEPGFFILGEKSYGRNNTFLMRVGWTQVEEVLTLLDEI